LIDGQEAVFRRAKHYIGSAHIPRQSSVTGGRNRGPLEEDCQDCQQCQTLKIEKLPESERFSISAMFGNQWQFWQFSLKGPLFHRSRKSITSSG
jgi:hypothetical protein